MKWLKRVALTLVALVALVLFLIWLFSSRN